MNSFVQNESWVQTFYGRTRLQVSDVIQVATALYATAAGREAFQHSSPDKGISIFGRALLDGLKGTPEIKLDPRQQRFARPPFGVNERPFRRV